MTKKSFKKSDPNYQKELAKSMTLDFDDLIMLTVQLFQKHPETLHYYQQKFQYIHVDEYQDTNPPPL